MSDMNKDHWPPIISGARRTAWIRWRGVAITAVMWGLYLFLLETEVALVGRAIGLFTGQPVKSINLDIEALRSAMRPATWVILILLVVLAVSTLASWRRRNAALLQVQPVPVPDCDLADDLGLSEQELHDIRRRKIVALDVDEQGKVSVRADWKPSAGHENTLT